MTKAAMLYLVTFFLIIMFCDKISSEPTSVGYNGVPDSLYDYYGPGYSPLRYNLGERVRFGRTGCLRKIVRVTNDDFIACNISNPISVLTDDTFVFEQLGDFYFICDHSLCDKNEDTYVVRIGHYEPTSGPDVRRIPGIPEENTPITPASAPAPATISPSPAPSTIYQSPATISPAPAISPSPSPVASGSPLFHSRKLGLFY